MEHSDAWVWVTAALKPSCWFRYFFHLVTWGEQFSLLHNSIHPNIHFKRSGKEVITIPELRYLQAWHGSSRHSVYRKPMHKLNCDM
jgi:hypothetical protein